MVLSWFGSGSQSSPKGASVDDLLAKKKYSQAVEILLEQFRQGSRDPRLRMQLADVMVLSGKGKEAIPILKGLADEYAVEGFAAKAIAVLKKIEKIEPGRVDVTGKLASLIEKRKSDVPSATGTFRAPALPEFGMEEIGMEAEPVTAPGPEFSIAADVVATSALAPATPAAPPAPVALPSRPAAPALTPAVARPSLPAAPPVSAPAAHSPLLEADGLELLDLGGPEPVVEPEPEATASGEGTGFLEDALLSVIQEALAAPPAAGQAAPRQEFVASPLFSDFSSDELVAVIAGLELVTYEPGDIVISQGEPGNSLFILTTGMVKAFVRKPEGHNVKVREMAEGAFFGEISILTGAPRTATVTAATPCEMLLLDRPTLDRICADKPRVIEVLQEFHRQRTQTR